MEEEAKEIDVNAFNPSAGGVETSPSATCNGKTQASLQSFSDGIHVTAAEQLLLSLSYRNRLSK